LFLFLREHGSGCIRCVKPPLDYTELLRTPFGRSSQDFPSTYSGA
jgi:hypothetical protein